MRRGIPARENGRRTRSDDGELYQETVHAFLTLFRHLRQYSRKVHDSGRSGRQLSALRFLLDHDACTMGALSAYLFINESSTTELVSKLESSEMVRRVRSPADNRVVLVSLTDAGRAAATETEVGGIPLLRERLMSLPDGDVMVMVAL